MDQPQKDQTEPIASAVEGKDSPPKNTLFVGNFDGQVSIDHPALDTDANGVGHIIFSPEQAMGLAKMLTKHADIAAGGDCCAQCGCTDHTPCTLAIGEPCYWWDKSLCSNPVCITASVESAKAGA